MGFFGKIFGAEGNGAVPTVTVTSPDPGEQPGDPGAFSSDYETAKDTPVLLTVANNGAPIVYINITAQLPNEDEPVLVYRGDPLGGFAEGFDADSSVTPNGTDYDFSIRRDGGWPPGDFSVTVDAFDEAGNAIEVP